jgi:hypothetical protein
MGSYRPAAAKREVSRSDVLFALRPKLGVLLGRAREGGGRLREAGGRGGGEGADGRRERERDEREEGHADHFCDETQRIAVV